MNGKSKTIVFDAFQILQYSKFSALQYSDDAFKLALGTTNEALIPFNFYEEGKNSDKATPKGEHEVVWSGFLENRTKPIPIRNYENIIIGSMGKAAVRSSSTE